MTHDAPCFRCRDPVTVRQFCTRYGIDPAASRKAVIDRTAQAFSMVPYENLTKIIKTDALVNPQSALRFPDEVLSDHLRWGTGGTCFSLTAAIIAVYDALGIEAQPLLADRHYGTDTHCGLVVMHENALLLVDPGYLFFKPTPLPETAAVAVPLGYTTIELSPIDGGRCVELITVVKGSRKVRLTYKRTPVDPETFVKAWETSFSWEMMTYPVLTRCTAGEHLYMQGTSVALRTAERTTRTRLDPSEQAAFIGSSMGIAQNIITKAWGVIRHGTT
jgi:arylamine N-acetyltransferase